VETRPTSHWMSVVRAAVALSLLAGVTLAAMATGQPPAQGIQLRLTVTRLPSGEISVTVDGGIAAGEYLYYLLYDTEPEGGYLAGQRLAVGENAQTIRQGTLDKSGRAAFTVILDPAQTFYFQAVVAQNQAALVAAPLLSNGAQVAGSPGRPAVTIRVVRVRFNWGQGSQAIALKDHETDAAVPVPEWDPGAGHNEPAAYVRGTRLRIQVQFERTGATTPAALTIGADGGLGGLANHEVAFRSSGLSDYVEFTAVQGLPDQIGVYELKWDWYWIDPYSNEAHPIGSSTHRVATTFRKPLKEPVYKQLVLWTSSWAAGLQSGTGDEKTPEKAIVDAIIKKLPQSGLKYGVGPRGGERPVDPVDWLLDNKGGMCSMWSQLFALMAASQGVEVQPYCYLLQLHRDESGQSKWLAIVIKAGGLNQTEPSFSPLTLLDLDSDYTVPIVDRVTPRTERRYLFLAPIDGHCVDFLKVGEKVYLYDPSFGTGPFAIDRLPNQRETWTGDLLAGFRSYHDRAIDYMLGKVRYKASEGASEQLTLLCIRTSLIGSGEIHYLWVKLPIP